MASASASDKRNERMLEEILKIPGNETCADCHAIAPRWASVNLGIFLCVQCASVHRKMGTHQSRIKSVTIDKWTREQIQQVKTVGNNASNAIYNPNEALHPPPTSTGSEDRDSEIEKYIRRKYEMGAFKAGSSARGGRNGNSGYAPTSLNRAREADGRLPSGSVTSGGPIPRSGSTSGSVGSSRNARNPELNDVLVRSPPPTLARERDLPALPAARGDAAPRPRPTRTPSGNNNNNVTAIPSAGSTPNRTPLKHNPFNLPNYGGANSAPLIDFGGGPSSTRPLQVTSNPGASGPSMGMTAGGYAGANPFNLNQMHNNNTGQSAAFNLSNSSDPIGGGGGMNGNNGVPNPFLQTQYGGPSMPQGFNHDTSQQHQFMPQLQHHHSFPPQPQAQSHMQNSGMGTGTSTGMGMGMGMGMMNGMNGMNPTPTQQGAYHGQNVTAGIAGIQNMGMGMGAIGGGGGGMMNGNGNGVTGANFGGMGTHHMTQGGFNNLGQSQHPSMGMNMGMGLGAGYAYPQGMQGMH